VTWVVLGGGFVGTAVTRRLLAGQEQVRSVRAPRLTADPSSSAEELAHRACTHPATSLLAEQLVGATVVVNAAGLARPDAVASPALTGANALLPAVVAAACARSRVARLVQISSAAVQGRRAVLDTSSEYAPFSAYSRSKALGEQALASATERPPSVVVLRATSVHGDGRPATDRLRRLAASRWSSVAGDGSRPTPVVWVDDLVEQVVSLGIAVDPPSVVLSPWSGYTTAGLLRELSGGREPTRVPMWLARAALAAGRRAVALPGLSVARGAVRRWEVLWLGQPQRPGPEVSPEP
jgi:nucleoside-diphosphate-sugar epimerase